MKPKISSFVQNWFVIEKINIMSEDKVIGSTHSKIWVLSFHLIHVWPRYNTNFTLFFEISSPYIYKLAFKVFFKDIHEKYTGMAMKGNGKLQKIWNN